MCPIRALRPNQGHLTKLAGGRRPALEMLDLCVSRVGQRPWVSAQFLAQSWSWLIFPPFDAKE